MAVGTLGTIVLVLVAGLLCLRGVRHRRWAHWERDRRLELEAYCTLEVSLPLRGDPRRRIERSKRVARLVTERSVFARCAVFLLDDAGRLVCAGSCGMNDLSLDSLDAWCARCLREETAATPHGHERRSEDTRTSFAVRLGSAQTLHALSPKDCFTATLVPVRLQRGRLVGLMAVCGNRKTRLNRERTEEAIAPLELLAAKLARTIERAMLVDRLIQVERLAGAAQLAAGVAEALVDPLRAVADRSELIAGTTGEARTREHALAIAAEAEGMSATVETLREAWRPREETSSLAAKTAS